MRMQKSGGCTALLASLLCQAGLAGNTIDCIENTGGGCIGGDCFDWRGPTRCDLGRCFCTEGTCAGGDGICTAVPYARPDNSSTPVVYRIRNARWPEYYIDIDFTGTVDFEKGCNGDDCKFTISMPAYAGGQEPLRAPIFLIASVRWPDATMMVVKDHDEEGYAAKVYSVDGSLGGWGADPSVAAVGMIITRAPTASPDGEVPIMLSSAQYSNRYLYIPGIGLSVRMHKNDPGAGGYWFFEPRLPEELRAQLLMYSGPRCSYSCGEIGSSRSVSSVNAAMRSADFSRVLASIAFGMATTISSALLS